MNKIKIQNMEKYSRKRAIVSICFCALTAALVFIGVSIRLVQGLSQYVTETGMKTYRMFTIESNIVVAGCALLAIPYEVDGIRNRNYHMPRWIIYVLYMGTTVVTLTFLVAVTILSPVAGYWSMMLRDSNIYLHTICPILSMVLFIFIANDHRIPLKMTWFALAPVLLYGAVYIYMCFILGEANGGWPDHYRFNVYLPWPITGVLLIAIAFGVATLLRLAHNKVHAYQKTNYEAFYKNMDYPDIESAIAAMGQKAKIHDPGNNDVVVPRRAFELMNERYRSDKTMEELSEIYLKNYLG